MAFLSLGLIGLGDAEWAAAQDSVFVAAEPEYRSQPPFGWLLRLLLSEQHRTLWANPVEVETLEFGDGGYAVMASDTSLLDPFLELRSPSGEAMRFHPLDPRFRDELVSHVPHSLFAMLLQDAVSAWHPGGPLVAASLARSAGLPVDDVRLRYLSSGDAPGPRLADQIGYLVPAPSPGSIDGLGVMDSMTARPDFPIDSMAYARGRMLDLLVGGLFEPDEVFWSRGADGIWRPGPTLRRAAMAEFGGLITLLGRPLLTSRASLDDVPPRAPVTPAQEAVDERILAPLSWTQWERAAGPVHGVSDAAVDSAVALLPPGWQSDDWDLADLLRARRDSLPRIARWLRERLLRYPVVVAAADVERVTAEWRGDTLVVDATPGDPRVFSSSETESVRLKLTGDAPVVLLGAAHDAPRLVVAASAYPTVVVDSASGAKVKVHDPADPEIASVGSDIDVDDEPLQTADLRDSRLEALIVDPPLPPSEGTALGLWLEFNITGDEGLLIGAGPQWTNYAPDRRPFDWRFRTRFSYSSAAGDGRAEVEFEDRVDAGMDAVLLRAMVSGIEVIRFYGYGNETGADLSDQDRYLRRQLQYVLSWSGIWDFENGRLAVGPIVKYVTTRIGGQPFPTGYLGLVRFGQVGFQADVDWDTRDWPSAPTRGLLASVGGSYYLPVWDAEKPFGELHGAIGTHFTPMSWLTFSPRVGAKRVWGEFPVHESAFLGGYGTMRGPPKNRFAGDASVWVNTDTRLTLTTLPLMVDWDFGLLGVFDVGRVWYEDEQSRKWHTGGGGGLFANLPDHTFAGVGYVMYSEGHWSLNGGISFYF